MSNDAFGLFGTPSPDDDGPGADFTGADIFGANMFTEEIEGIDASDWDVDSDLLWAGDGAEATIEIGDGVFDTDFPI